MTFTVFVCNTVTGENLGPVDVQISSWTRVLNGSETASVVINPDDGAGGLSAANRDWWRQYTSPGLISLVIDWDGTPVWAGPIVNRQTSGAQVTVNASGILFLLTRRKLADPNSATAVTAQSYTWEGALGYIAVQLVQFALARAGGALPIVVPALAADTSNTYTWAGSDLNTVSDLLSTLTGIENGPDIDFQPRWVDSNRSAIQWVMRVGTTSSPRITTANQIAWDATAPLGGVADVQATDDISNMVTTDWAKGDAGLISVAQSTAFTGLGYPLLDGETDYTSVADQSTLDAHTAGDLANFGRPTDQWVLLVDALSDPQLGTYDVGDLPTVNFQGHFWVPDGLYTMRIVQVEGDNTTQVKVTVQGSDAAGLDIIGSPADGIGARVARLERLI